MDGGWILALVASLVAVWVLFIVVLWIFRPRNARLSDAIRLVPDLLRMIRGLIADGGVPLGVRASLVALLAWLLNPIDLVPEFIPVLGPLDDVVVAVLVLRYVRRRLGDDELRRRWPGSPEGFELLSGIIGSR
ncbi:MAG: YkvA family protein [Candidatus Limnocylindria bacterium]